MARLNAEWLLPPISDFTLNELEHRLTPGRFFCVSRATLVNLDGVAEVHPQEGGGGEVVMKCGQRLGVSRRQWWDLLGAVKTR